MAFVNARGDYGNTALHLAVEHCNCATIAWLLDFTKSGKGRGRASLTLLNKDRLTPYTKAVRMAQEREDSLEAFEQEREREERGWGGERERERER